MTEISKKAIYKHFNGTSYERINFKTTASQVDQEENLQFVSKADKINWNGKATKDVATKDTAGLMSAADKIKLSNIQEGANKYTPPDSYLATNITTDYNHLFVTKSEKDSWNGKASKDVATQTAAGLMSVVDKKKLDGLINIVYPVGSIYMSVVDKDPKDFIGGKWQRWGAGMVPVGVNTGDSSFNTVEKKGGEKSHTLSVNEMPRHEHNIGMRHGKDYVIPNQYGTGGVAYSGGTQGHWFVDSVYATANGGGAAHNNLQPYITCYMWKRIE